MLDRATGALAAQALTEQPILHDGQKIGSVEVKGSGGSLLRFLLTGLAGMVLCLLLTAPRRLLPVAALVRGIVGPLDQLASCCRAYRARRTGFREARTGSRHRRG
ncbi:hypothetical protein P4110_10240 [Pseudomonas aeruginosa]|nr:hypothetical protein [Pseudomonas aeruginosa]